jgi:hypothetical protein
MLARASIGASYQPKRVDYQLLEPWFKIGACADQVYDGHGLWFTVNRSGAVFIEDMFYSKQKP